MGEAVVLPLIEKLGAALAIEVVKPAFSWLVEQVSLLREVRASIDRIRSEFVVMDAFLRCDNSWRAGDEPAAAWVEEVRDVAYTVEDIIDEYCHLMRKPHRRGLKGSLCKLVHQSGKLAAWRSIAAQLQEIEAKLLNLSNTKERYSIKTSSEGERSNGNGGRRRHLDEAVHFVGEEEIVGIEMNKSLLVSWLMDEEELQCRTISVWGMGGLGKTTLVASAYRSQAIKRHFSCYAWVSISQVYKADDLLRRITKEFFEEMDMIHVDVDTMGYKKLVKTLQAYLNNKRYLIILDDVWHMDVWSDICGALPECSCGSRILITTRNHDVALLARERHILKLEHLQESEARELFCRKAFSREENRSCPLEYWARKVVEKCRGLPLSISVIGSLLSLRERKELEWKKVHDRLNWELVNNTEHDRVRNILHLSFDDLPGHLKNWFLYCSIFPEDQMIRRKKLIRLWVAEGFVGERTGNTMEEVAEDYLNQLIHLSMLQVVKRNSSGRVKAFRMHDLMRELSLLRCRRENFCAVYDSLELANQIIEARHLSVRRTGSTGTSSGVGDIQPNRNRWYPRSFIVFDAAASASLSPGTAARLTIPPRFKLLRVLDLQGVTLRTIPEQVADLFNLHYLGLRNTQVEGLPKSLRRLHNLQTLDLWGTHLDSLPRWTTRLVKLRHLFVFKPNDRTFRAFSALPGAEAPKGLSGLKNLQTLSYLEADAEMVREAGELTELRTLGITKVRAAHCTDLCASVARMGHLLTLAVAAADEGESLQLDNLTPPPPLLHKLALWGRMENGALPPWMGGLTNLTNLTLYWCQLRDDPLPALSCLPSLVHLYLRNAYEGQALHFFPASFPKLKSLFLVDMIRVQWASIEDGALAGLRQLGLVRCGELRAVPLGIEYLPVLQELFLREMSSELVEKLRGENGEDDRMRTERIPIVTHVFQRDGEWIREVRRSRPTL